MMKNLRAGLLQFLIFSQVLGLGWGPGQGRAGSPLPTGRNRRARDCASYLTEALRAPRFSSVSPAAFVAISGVHLAHLRLRDFRNYARLDADFAPGFHLLLGDNAQGKTNVLEAIYLVATLRSFRGVGGGQMVRHGQKGYFVGQPHRRPGAARNQNVLVVRRCAALSLDGRPVRKLTDYLGVLRTVVFCTEDLLLIKGPGRARRRFLDLLLSQTHPTYLPLLAALRPGVALPQCMLKAAGAWTRSSLDSFSVSWSRPATKSCACAAS